MKKIIKLIITTATSKVNNLIILNFYLISNPTGQWSLPITSGKIIASLTFVFISSETIK